MSSESQRCNAWIPRNFWAQVVLAVLLCLNGFASLLVALLIARNAVCDGDRKTPLVQLHKFTVSNLNISDELDIRAAWEANLSINNPSNRNTLGLQYMQGFVYFKSTDNVLSGTMTWKDQYYLSLKPHTEATINVAGGSIQPDNDLVAEVLSRLHQYKSVTFGLKLRASGKASCVWPNEHIDLEVTCDILKVDFKLNDSTGSFVPNLDQPKECFTSLD